MPHYCTTYIYPWQHETLNESPIRDNNNTNTNKPKNLFLTTQKHHRRLRLTLELPFPCGAGFHVGGFDLHRRCLARRRRWRQKAARLSEPAGGRLARTPVEYVSMRSLDQRHKHKQRAKTHPHVVQGSEGITPPLTKRLIYISVLQENGTFI